MRILKKIVLVTFLFLTTVLVIAYFLPSGYTLTRSAEINAEPVQVYTLVASISQWKYWHELLEHAHIQNDEASDTALNQVIKWTDAELTSGSISITDRREGVFVRAEIQFEKPSGMFRKELWSFERTGNGTKVSLHSEGNLPFPFERLLGLYIRRKIETQTDKSLFRLKQLAESGLE